MGGLGFYSLFASDILMYLTANSDHEDLAYQLRPVLITVVLTKKTTLAGFK